MADITINPEKEIYAVVRYSGENGCYVRVFFQHDQLISFLKKLRRPAKVHNRKGEIVGGIENNPIFDDRRIKWHWWYDPDQMPFA